MNSRNRFLLALLVGSGWILLFNLWGRHLENHDFLRYAEVAREMIRSGDWVVLRFNGEVYLHKPPFLIWLIAFPSNLHGFVTPFLARLPSALFAWIGTVVVYLWGRSMWGEDRDGLIAAGTLVSTNLYFWQARIARTDMVFSVFILLSLYFFYLSYQRKKPFAFPVLCCVFIAMAGFTKGPVGVVFPFLIILVFLIKQRRLGLLIQKEFLLGYLTIVLLFGLWLIPYLYRVGWETALSTWQETRILSRRAPFYVYGLHLWGNFAPWSVFLPFLVYHYWKKAWSRDEEFLILWFVSLFIVLTLFPVRASKYLLPAFPPLALLMVGFLRKRSLSLFCLIFLSALLAFHGYEYRLIRKNDAHKPGSVLFQEFRKYRDREITGYRMDIGILGTINFYEDRVIPQIKHVEDLKEGAREKDGFLIVTVEGGLQELIKESFLITSNKKIDHREGSIFLVEVRYDKER